MCELRIFFLWINRIALDYTKADKKKFKAKPEHTLWVLSANKLYMGEGLSWWRQVDKVHFCVKGAPQKTFLTSL